MDEETIQRRKDALRTSIGLVTFEHGPTRALLVRSLDLVTYLHEKCKAQQAMLDEKAPVNVCRYCGQSPECPCQQMDKHNGSHR